MKFFTLNDQWLEPKNPKAAEKEAWIQEAIAVIHASHLYCPYSLQCPLHTFNDCLKRKWPHQLAQEKQVLRHVKEKELIRWITHLTRTDYSPHYSTI